MKKMKTLKSTIALILALAMICAYLPAGVLAIEATDWWTEDWSANSAELWNKVTEDNEVVMQSLHSGDPVLLTYRHSLTHMDSISFDLRVDEFKADVGNAGIALYSDAGTAFFAYYNSGEHKVVLMDQSRVLDTPLVAGQWYTWNLHWDATTITLSIDGQQLISYNYSATGHTFTSAAKLAFSFWWHTSSVKNVSVYRDWDVSQWTVNLPDQATETRQGAASILHLTQSEMPVTLSYNGSTVGMNTLDFDMRINADDPGGGNAGVALRPVAGGEAFYNLYTAANMFRMGDAYIGSPKTEIVMGEYYHWRYQWDGTYLYIFINDKLQLQYDYSSTGHNYDGAAILFSFWRHNVDLKNISLSNSAVASDWDYTLWESVGWTPATEDGVTVYSTSQGPHALNYSGYLDGKNVFEADIRQNGGAADVGHVNMGIRTWDGQVRYFSYNPGTATMRVFNEWDVLQDSVTLDTPLTEGAWQHWKVTWNNGILALSIDGTAVISCDYAAAGLDLSYGATCYVGEYFDPASAKNLVVGTDWDTEKWTANGNWGTTAEDGSTVLTSLELDGVLTLNYTGNLDGMNRFDADVRVNELYDSNWGNAGFLFEDANGKKIFICYRASARGILIFNEADQQLASATLSEDMVRGEFVHWQFVWDGSVIRLYLDGSEAISFDYAAAGMDLSSGAKLLLSRWRHGVSVKNLVISNTKPAPAANWTDSWTPVEASMWYSMLCDGSYTVKSATASNDPAVVMSYNATINGMKSVEMDIRFDRIKNSGGNVGIGIRTAAGAEYYLNYYCYDGVNAIIRKGSETVTEGVPVFRAGEWHHWKLSWDESNIYLSIDGDVLATCAHNGDLAGATVIQSNWMYGTSIRDVVFTETEAQTVSDWTDEWSGAGWTESEEDGTPIMSAPNDLCILQYAGKLDGKNTLEADIRIDSIGVDFGNITILLETAEGKRRNFSYTHGTKAMRVFNESDQLLDSVEMAQQLTVGTYQHWKVQWDGQNMTISIDDEQIMSYNYAADGLDFTTGATALISEWYHAATVKNLKLSYIAPPVIPDWTDEWSGAGWTESEEDGTPIMSAPNDLCILQYAGKLDGKNTLEADIRIDSIGVDFGNITILLETAEGKRRNFSYTHGTKAMRVFNESDQLLDSVEMAQQLTVGTYQHWKVQWDGQNMTISIDEEQIMSYNYAADGLDFTTGATALISEWYHAATAKNITLSNQQIEAPLPGEDWRASGWTSADENGETVWTAQGTGNEGNRPTMTWTGSLENMNSLSFRMRYNATNWVEGWVGVTLTDSVNGAQYLIDYRADANGVRIRRNDVYLVYTGLSFIPADNAWMDWQIMWSDTTLYLKVNDVVVLQYNYASQGDVFDAQSRIAFKAWGVPASVKNMEVSKVTSSAWNYIDLEFADSEAVESFTVTGGTASFSNGAMVVDITAGGAVIESPNINVTPGDKYSAFLPVRNTLVVRLKNDTDADQIKLYFRSTRNGDYSERCSKTFEIEPNSGWKTYFFNISDVIYMGAAANSYKYVSQVIDDCEGYLRGFRLVLPENVTEGSVSIDAVTFEREEPLYDYAGEITSTIADVESSKITVTGKVDPSQAGKTVVIYESAVNNYNESMSYPMHTEHDTVMVDIEKLAEAVVAGDGTFCATLPLYNGDVSRLSSLFLAWIDGVKVSGHFSVDNYEDFYPVDRFEVPELTVKVTDAQFGAKGDAFTDDTKAIQAAIDYVAARGGGVVVLPGDTSTWYGRRYIATNINLRSNIELRIEEGAMIWQSQREEEYDYSNNNFLEKPVYGHDNDREGVVWAHSINDNLPLLYIGGEYDHSTGQWGKAITNVRITGGGTVRMVDTGGEQPDPHNYAWNSNICVGCSNRIHIAPVVFWNAENCDLVGITIQRTNSWHVTSSAVNNMYFANNTLEQAACINSDSFGCVNSKNMTIFRNFVYGNDDGVTLTTTAEDKRAHEFYFIDPDRDNATENISIISNQIWNGLGIAFIPWGTGGEDLSRYAIKNIMIYDNVLGGESCAIGAWPDNPTYGWSSYYTYNLDKGETDDWSPIQDVSIINNRLRKPYNMRVAQIANLIIENTTYRDDKIGYYDSQAANQFLYGNFDRVIRSVVEANGFKDETNWTVGLANWSSILGDNGSVGTEKVREDLHYSGYIKGNGQLFQGLYVISGTHELKIKVKAVSGETEVFVADRDGNVIARKSVPENSDFEQVVLKFVAPESNVYRLGVMHSGNADQIVYLDDAVLANSVYEPQIPVNAQTVTYPFKEASELEDFRLLNSTGNGGFVIEDDKLVATVGDGEYKAMVKATNRRYHHVSVEIYPGASGKINAGIYLGASGASSALDRINALSVLVESNFTGWADAGNRIDVIFGEFPEWKELYRFTSESAGGNSLYAGGEKEPLKLDLFLEGNVVVVTLSLLDEPAIFTQTAFEYVGELDLQAGTVGLRALDSDCVYDNLTLTYTQTASESQRDEGQLIDKVSFDSMDSADSFDFYHSSEGGFVVKDGKLVPTGETGEFKAIYRDDNASFSTISVDIYPGSDGINSGIYIGAGKVDHGVDKIKALVVYVESNFPHEGEEAWDDAVNRIDLVVGQFPIWKELHRYTSETGAGNALYAGSKEPVNLRVDIDGKLVTITLSLLSDPSVFVTTTYEYQGNDDLSVGDVGLRSAFNNASFDNFTVYGTSDKTDDGETGNSSDDNAGSVTPNTADTTPLAVIVLTAMTSMAALIVLAWQNSRKKHFAV